MNKAARAKVAFGHGWKQHAGKGSMVKAILKRMKVDNPGKELTAFVKLPASRGKQT